MKDNIFGRNFFRRKTKGWRRVRSWGEKQRSHLWLMAKGTSGRSFQSFTLRYCKFSRDESWVRWTNPHELSFSSTNHPVLLFANVLTTRVNERLRCGWLCNWNHSTLSANQMGTQCLPGSKWEIPPYIRGLLPSSRELLVTYFLWDFHWNYSKNFIHMSWFASWKEKNRNLAFFLTAHCIKL